METGFFKLEMMKSEEASELLILIYYLNSASDEELFCFIKAFFRKYDPDCQYMLDFNQFKNMMERMARKFSVDTMNNYLLLLDKANFQKNIQKDKLLQQKDNPDDYFGPFLMESVFNIFKGEIQVFCDGLGKAEDPILAFEEREGANRQSRSYEKSSFSFDLRPDLAGDQTKGSKSEHNLK